MRAAILSRSSSAVPTSWKSSPTLPHSCGWRLSQSISNAMDRCGVRATPHALRHWFASRALADGADIYTVRDLLRHRNVSTTAIYSQPSTTSGRPPTDHQEGPQAPLAAHAPLLHAPSKIPP